MNGIEYLVNSSAWSLGGLAVGYLLGRLHSRLRGIERHLDRMDEEERRDDT